jgi:hypothetical protein
VVGEKAPATHQAKITEFHRNVLLVRQHQSRITRYLGRPSQTVVYFGESRGGADRVVSLVIVSVLLS